MRDFLRSGFNRIVAVAIAAVFSLSGYVSLGQESAVKAAEPLFKYPVAPDTIATLEGRTNYIVSKFWDNFNMSKHIADSAAFDAAFRDYVTFFKYAHKNIVFSSIKNFMNKAQSNLANYIMVMKIAEKALYAPGAEFWSDEAYLPFAKFFVNSKKVKSAQKQHYIAQIKKIEQNEKGADAPDFTFVMPDKSKKRLSDIKDGWVLIFFNDDSSDCSIARLRLSTDVTVNRNIDENKVTVLSIFPGKYSGEWAEEARTYSDKWIIGACEDADDTFDIRFTPSFYILDRDHKIVEKNLNLETVKGMFVR
ncbi:MAG: DUF5106 domain-containing protein [Muribaculaceae bacterium]